MGSASLPRITVTSMAPCGPLYYTTTMTTRFDDDEVHGDNYHVSHCYRTQIITKKIN